MTASKVKSQSSNINVSKGTTTTVVDEIKQEIQEIKKMVGEDK